MLGVVESGYPSPEEVPMRRKMLPAAVAAGVLLSGAGVACDKEDRRDVREVGEDVEKGIDDLDSDGKDD
jgi:hypothetical protein